MQDPACRSLTATELGTPWCSVRCANCERDRRLGVAPAPFFLEPRRLPLPARDLRSCSSSPFVLTASFGAFDASASFADAVGLPFTSDASLPAAVQPQQGSGRESTTCGVTSRILAAVCYCCNAVTVSLA